MARVPPGQRRPRRPALPFPGGAGSSRLRPHPARDRPAARDVDRDRRPHARTPPRREASTARRAVVFTGSGSSIYAAECVAPCLQHGLGVPVSAVPAGLILTHPETCLPPNGPFLVVSLARSGNSPESRAVVDWLLESRPQARHLFITCNRTARSPRPTGTGPGVRAIVLDEKTNDRSLVMTSSFTNMVLAGRALGGRSPGLRGARSWARAGRCRACCGNGREALDARRAERLRLGRLPRQRLPPRLRPRGRAQDAGDERRAGLHLRRVLPRPAARAHVGDPRGHPGGGFPVVRPAGAGLREGRARASSTARGSARAA